MAIKSRDLLGMNARDFYTSQNSSWSKKYTTSKYATKALLENKNIPTPAVYAVFATNEDVNTYDWENLNGNFVIKPTNGNAGKGVIAFRRQHKDHRHWTDVVGETWSLDDIKLHCYDILEGLYSTYGSNHSIIVEERIPIHKTLLKYTYKGTPDVRVVIYNKIPVMALLRLPTRESEGRANQSQGAIGVGIDMASGVTTYAAKNLGTPIKLLPGTKLKLNGIKLPYWKKLLTIAVQATEAAQLQYAGIDLFIHDEKGPMVVEINANPGLSIQIANQSGLRKRLERVEGINVLNPEHGVRISQALFAESFSDKIIAKEGLTIIPPKTEIFVYSDTGASKRVPCLINTGRYRSAIASKLAEELGLIDIDDLLWFQNKKDEGQLAVVEVSYKLKNNRHTTPMLVSKKMNSQSYKVEIGRNNLHNFVVGQLE